MPKIASCRTFRPAAVQLRKLAAGGEISDIAHVCIAVIDSFTQIEEHGTMEDSAEHYTLSYPVWSVTWDGRRICGRPLEESCGQLDELAACGIYEVMLSGYHCEEEADFDMDAETVKLGAALRERGMKGAQHHSLVSMWTTPGESQAEVIRRMKKCVDYTANLNADVVVFHAMKFLGGTDMGEDIRRRLEDAVARTSEAAVLETIQENLHAAGQYARERGVLIALENLDRFTPWCDMANLPELVRGADSEAVGFCLDTGHAWCCGRDPAEWVPVMGDKLFTTHVHDNHGLPAKFAGSGGLIDVVNEHLDEHLSPGLGTISWRDFIRALRKSGYRRTLNFETNGWPGLEGRDAYRFAIQFWRTCECLAAEHAN